MDASNQPAHPLFDASFVAQAQEYPDLVLARVVAQFSDLYKILGEEGEALAEISNRSFRRLLP